MSKMTELDICVGELRNAAQSLTSVAESLAVLFSGDAYVATEASPVTQTESPTSTPITLEAVRAVLIEKSRAGHTALVRGLLEKYGAAKLSEIDPAEYPALMKEAEGLTDG